MTFENDENELPRLFSGKFQETVKKVVKKEISESTIEKVRSTPVSLSFSAKRGGGSGYAWGSTCRYRGRGVGR